MNLTENDLKYLQKPEGIWEWRRPSKGDRYRGYRRTIAGELGVVKQISDTPRKALKQLHILREELGGYRWCAPSIQARAGKEPSSVSEAFKDIEAHLKEISKWELTYSGLEAPAWEALRYLEKNGGLIFGAKGFDYWLKIKGYLSVGLEDLYIRYKEEEAVVKGHTGKQKADLTEEDMEWVSVGTPRNSFIKGGLVPLSDRDEEIIAEMIKHNPVREGEFIIPKKQLDKLKASSTVIISPEGKIKVSKNDLLNYGIAYLQSKLGGVSIEIEEEEEKGVSDEEFEDMKEQLVNYFGRKSK